MNQKHFEDAESLKAVVSIARGLGENWLLEQARDGGAIAAKMVQRLRTEYGPTVARWLVEFAAAHPKAVEKFGEGRWLATQRGIQQATDRHTAAYKAERFPAGEPVIDLCCGIGGDAIALARRGPTLAVDRDPHVARIAAANLREAVSAAAEPPARSQQAALVASETMVAAVDVKHLLPLPAGGLIHIDPDRRPGERRTIDPARYQPSIATVSQALETARGAAVKLAPASAVPPAWENHCMREWISFRGSVRQQVAWFGELCGTAGPGVLQATRLRPDGTSDSFAAESQQMTSAVASTGSIGALIADLDPAVRAAGLSEALAETLGLRAIGGPAGFFTTDRLDCTHPLAETYEILWSGAGNLKAMEAAVREAGLRIEAIKVRGGPLRPEKIQKKIRQAAISHPNGAGTLMIGSIGKRCYAVIGKRLTPAAEVSR